MTLRRAHVVCSWYGRNIGELSADPVVARYAWSLLAVHWIIFIYYFSSERLVTLAGAEPFCWPYFEDCWRLRPLTLSGVALLAIGHATLLVGTTIALGLERRPWFFWLLVSTNIYVFGMMSLDYRFRSNELYMAFWLNTVFLWWPRKRWSIPILLVSFYFWAGRIKMNYEWLSGTALYEDLWLIPGAAVPVACAYVVILEMLFIWGLLAERPLLRWGTLLQLALFHLQSLSQIVWFYPALMAAMLSWFVIEWYGRCGGERADLRSLWSFRAPAAAYALAALFGFVQLSPTLYRGERELTGQGRIVALHMFEARQLCDVRATLRFATGESREMDLYVRSLPPRVVCDPIVYLSRITAICRRFSQDPRFVDADWFMEARRTTDAHGRVVIDEHGVCGKRIHYNIFQNNSWLR